jgi:glycosyltransferase involved in cell wall biosynthesis
MYSQTKKPIFSVIIPAYNEAESIEKCLKAVLNQDYLGLYEVIVVNGPSTDQTFVIAQSMGVRAIQLSKRGISVAWQEGSFKARGDILAFTEADTVVPENWLSTIDKFYKNNSDVIGTVGIYKLNNYSCMRNQTVMGTMMVFDWLYFLWKKHYSFRGTNFSIKKQILEELGGFNIKVLTHGDVELASRAYKRGRIRYTPELAVVTSNRHLRSIGNLINFTVRLVRAIYFIDVIQKPQRISSMFDVR